MILALRNLWFSDRGRCGDETGGVWKGGEGKREREARRESALSGLISYAYLRILKSLYPFSLLSGFSQTLKVRHGVTPALIHS